MQMKRQNEQVHRCPKDPTTRVDICGTCSDNHARTKDKSLLLHEIADLFSQSPRVRPDVSVHSRHALSKVSVSRGRKQLFSLRMFSFSSGEVLLQVGETVASGGRDRGSSQNCKVARAKLGLRRTSLHYRMAQRATDVGAYMDANVGLTQARATRENLSDRVKM
jgi:hypothetical protein